MATSSQGHRKAQAEADAVVGGLGGEAADGDLGRSCVHCQGGSCASSRWCEDQDAGLRRERRRRPAFGGEPRMVGKVVLGQPPPPKKAGVRWGWVDAPPDRPTARQGLCGERTGVVGGESGPARTTAAWRPMSWVILSRPEESHRQVAVEPLEGMHFRQPEWPDERRSRTGNTSRYFRQGWRAAAPVASFEAEVVQGLTLPAPRLVNSVNVGDRVATSSGRRERPASSHPSCDRRCRSACHMKLTAPLGRPRVVPLVATSPRRWRQCGRFALEHIAERRVVELEPALLEQGHRGEGGGRAMTSAGSGR